MNVIEPIEPRQRWLGIDPSFRRTGWALVMLTPDGVPTATACGSIVPKSRGRSEGLLEIQLRLLGILRECSPCAAILERPGRWMHRVGSSRESIEVMAMSRGVMLAACAGMGIPAFEVDFRHVRQALIGRPNIGAKAVAEFVQGLGFDLPRRPQGAVDLDVANAILMGLYGLSLSAEP